MSLEVKACAALTEPERAEILALQNEVYSGENLKNTVWLQTESHFDRTVPCFYLGRENDALTAFLSLFLPTQEEAEVTAFTKAIRAKLRAIHGTFARRRKGNAGARRA